MDIIITAVGEFIWTTSCGIVNFCLSSGLSVLTVFISFLCAILASAFYKYTMSNKQDLSNDDTLHNITNDDNWDPEKCDEINSTLKPLLTTELAETSISQSNETNFDSSLSDIQVSVNANIDEDNKDDQQMSDDILLDTIEGSEEEIQKKQIANIYRLLNDQNLANNWTTTDFVDQLKMYGFQSYDENELESY